MDQNGCPRRHWKEGLLDQSHDQTSPRGYHQWQLSCVQHSATWILGTEAGASGTTAPDRGNLLLPSPSPWLHFHVVTHFLFSVTDYPTDAAKQRKYLFELVVSVPHGTEGPAVLKAAGPCDQGTHLSTSGSWKGSTKTRAIATSHTVARHLRARTAASSECLHS